MFPRYFITRQMVLGVAAGLGLCASSAMAQVVINFDENGKGTIHVPGAATIPLISLGNITDPIDPGNGLKPLAYNLIGTLTVAPTDGDINLFEPTGVDSDLLRFEHGLLLVYSDLSEPIDPSAAADVGLPTFRQQNVLSLQEMGPESGPDGLFGYTPAAGAPGALAAPSVYNFTSDPGVPEPAAAALLGVGSLLLLRRRRRQ